VVVALTLIALFLGVGLAYASARMNNLFHKQQQYQNYSNVLNDLLFNLTNAETGQRGYLITEDRTYLGPYDKAIPMIRKDLHVLKISPLSNNYRQHIDQITTISTQKLGELSLTISTLQSQGQPSAFTIVGTNTGKEDMIRLRALIGDITRAQNKDIHAKVATAEHRTAIMKFVAPIAGLLDLGLIATILYLTRRAIHKEQQLENLKEQFVALASHQLRTPATAVKQYLNLLLAGTFGKLKKQQQDVLVIINDSNERGIHIANNLLSVSRASNKEVHISDKPINLSQLLKEVVNHYKKAIEGSKGQKIIVTIPGNPILARVDSFYIRLIFENLIENASKYSDTKKKIHVSLAARKDTIIFTVKDEGQGISKRDMPLLFKKFSRLDQAIKKADGSGLGLYLVRQATLLHGGDVSIKSVNGKGSTFTVKIRQDL
jgi:signal transduction histidine kinase